MCGHITSHTPTQSRIHRPADMSLGTQRCTHTYSERHAYKISFLVTHSWVITGTHRHRGALMYHSGAFMSTQKHVCVHTHMRIHANSQTLTRSSAHTHEPASRETHTGRHA